MGDREIEEETTNAGMVQNKCSIGLKIQTCQIFEASRGRLIFLNVPC
jgi:hypothetical protein